MKETEEKKTGRPVSVGIKRRLNFYTDREIEIYLKNKEKEMGISDIDYNMSWLLRGLFRQLKDWEELTTEK